MKTDLSVSRTMTINTGNYSSVKPSVSLTIKDVESANIREVYKQMNKIADSLMYYETKELIDNSITINDIGVDRFMETLPNFQNDIENQLDEAMEMLK